MSAEREPMSAERGTDATRLSTASRVILEEGGSAASKYRSLTAGDTSFAFFALFELACFFLGGIPGALGLLIRRKIFPRFLGSCGARPVIGRNCVLRHPRKIHLGDDVVLDDYCLVDARGTGEGGMRLGDRTIVNRYTQIVSKGGDVAIGSDSSIGGASIIVSWSGVSIGNGVSIAAECIVSAGTYPLDQMSLPRDQRAAKSAGPIQIGDHSWIATRVTILDAVSIGSDSVVSAGAVVHRSVPPNSVAHGNPAKVVFTLRD